MLDILAPTTQHILVIPDGARDHTSKAMEELFAAHGTCWPKVQLPAYAPDCNPSAYLWKKGQKMATPLQHFPAFTRLQAEVDKAWLHFAPTPQESMALMTRYCDSLGARAA